MRRFSKTTFHCPNCDKILTVATHIGDYIHDCRDFPVIEVNATQDVTNIGDSTEFGAVVVTKSCVKAQQIQYGEKGLLLREMTFLNSQKEETTSLPKGREHILNI